MLSHVRLRLRNAERICIKNRLNINVSYHKLDDEL